MCLKPISRSLQQHLQEHPCYLSSYKMRLAISVRRFMNISLLRLNFLSGLLAEFDLHVSVKASTYRPFPINKEGKKLETWKACNHVWCVIAWCCQNSLYTVGERTAVTFPRFHHGFRITHICCGSKTWKTEKQVEVPLPSCVIEIKWYKDRYCAKIYLVQKGLSTDVPTDAYFISS